MVKILDQGLSFIQLGLRKIHKEMLSEAFFFSGLPIAKVAFLLLVFTPGSVLLNQPQREQQ